MERLVGSSFSACEFVLLSNENALNWLPLDSFAFPGCVKMSFLL